MQNARQATRVARIHDGWAWTPSNGEDAPVAAGTAPEQQAAMERAWCAARSFAPAASKAYPELFVERPRERVGRAA
jgi:hypothetical protein